METKKFISIFMAAGVILLWAIFPVSASALYPTGIGWNPAVDYNMPNFAYSPNIRKFVDTLPGLGWANRNNLGQYIPVAVADKTTYPGSDFYDLTASQFPVQMSQDLPPTTIRGYAQTLGTGPGQSNDPNIGGKQQYLGPAIIAMEDVPVRVLFRNMLPLSNQTVINGMMGMSDTLPLPLDKTIMGAGMGPTTGFNFNDNRMNVHLHGGHTPWISDGTPHQWITPAGDTTPYKKGVSFQNVPDMIGNTPGKVPNTAGDGMGTLYWTNQQSGRLMFFHDHAWGITRLNVYAGMAAPYLLVSPTEQDLIAGTNNSGVFGTGTPVQIIPDQNGLDNGTGLYHYGIPLVIQDKAFVNDATTPGPAAVAAFPAGYTPTGKTLTTDPLWGKYVGTTGGNLWMGHEYLPIENIFDPTGNTWNGRWDYAPFMNPPAIPTNLMLPSPTAIPEAFGDTMVVNGCAFPYITLPPQPIRFRILGVGNDRVLNLQWYKADPLNPTEVVMVEACPNPKFPTWPKDGRDGGVPDPNTAGPDWIQIGNESGFLAQAAVWPPQPIDYEYNRQTIPFAGVKSRSLLLMPAQRADVIVDFNGYKDGDVLILYNDAPAPMPMFWSINDFYTNNPDQTAVGGAPTTPPGFGPNTRTVMQVRIKGPKTSNYAVNLPAIQTAIPKAFANDQPKPEVGQLAYNAAFPGIATKDIYAQNVDSTLNVTGAAGPITSIMTTLAGTNYTTPPTVKIIPRGGDVGGATATAGLNPIGGITLVTTGSGYATPPTVTISAPNGGLAGILNIQATAVATLTGGGVSAITILEPGSNYSTVTAATVTFTGGTALPNQTIVPPTATAMVATANTVGSIQVNTGGSYTVQPMVYLIPAAGTNAMGATAVALIRGAIPMTGEAITEGFDNTYARMDIRMGSIPNPLTPNVGAGMVVGIAQYIDPPTEFVNDNQVTLWRISHLGVDSHSLHFHLFDVQVVNRVDWTNVVKPPYPDEIGWRETIRTNPMEDIIVAFRPRKMILPFALPVSNRLLDPTTVAGSTVNFNPIAAPLGVAAVAQLSNVMTNFGWEYVYHCHMLGHEENDFMRPMVMNPLAASAYVLQAPTNLVTRLSGTAAAPSVTLTFRDNANNETGFQIDRSTDGGVTWAKLATLPPHTGTGNTSWTDTTVVMNNTYSYRVKALFGALSSAYSNIRTITVSLPLAPSNVTVVAQLIGSSTTSDRLRVTLKNNANNESSFTMQYSTNSNMSGATVRTVNSTIAPGTTLSITTNVPKGQSYYVQVRANNTLGSSAWVNATPFPVAAP